MAASQSSLLVAMIHLVWMAIRHPMKTRHSQDHSLIIVRSRLLPRRKFLLPNLWITTRLQTRRANYLRGQVLPRRFVSTLRFRLTAHRLRWSTDQFIETRHLRPVSHQLMLLQRSSPKQIQATADIPMPTTLRMVPIHDQRTKHRIAVRARGGVLRAQKILVQQRRLLPYHRMTVHLHPLVSYH